MEIELKANLRVHLYVYGYDSTVGTYPSGAGFTNVGEDPSTFLDGADNFVDYSN